MGIAVKYVKDKGTGGGNPPTQQSLLPIEKDFYNRLQLKVIFSGNSLGLPSTLKAQLESLLRKSASGVNQEFTELAPEFKYLYMNEAYVGDVETFSFDTYAATKSRLFKVIRISFRVCAITEEVSFLVFHFTSEYISQDGNLWREDGECVQTWQYIQNSWRLLGQFIDGVQMELQGRILPS